MGGHAEEGECGNLFFCFFVECVIGTRMTRMTSSTLVGVGKGVQDVWMETRMGRGDRCGGGRHGCGRLLRRNHSRRRKAPPSSRPHQHQIRSGPSRHRKPPDESYGRHAALLIFVESMAQGGAWHWAWRPLPWADARQRDDAARRPWASCIGANRGSEGLGRLPDKCGATCYSTWEFSRAGSSPAVASFPIKPQIARAALGILLGTAEGVGSVSGARATPAALGSREAPRHPA